MRTFSATVILIASCCTFLAGTSSAAAQSSSHDKKEEPNSPVFKGYKPPDELPLLGPSDEAYQAWMAFNAALKAGSGDVLAQHELGIRYLLGRGVEKDTVKAAYWIRKAAEQNLVPARFNLGILEYYGWGEPWNPFGAFRDFEYCAEQNMAEAQFIMGEFYTENLIVPQDFQKAYMWVKKAVDAGYKPAAEVLRELDKRIAKKDSSSPTPASVAPVFLDVPEDTLSSASEWTVLKSALRDAGPELSAALGLSRMLDGTLDVDSLSFQSIELAAERGSPEALSVLARCYEKGIMVRKDLVQAAVQYIRAIRMDSPRSTQLLWKMMQEKGFLQEMKRRAREGDPAAEFAWAGLAALGFDAYLTQGQAVITGDEALRFLKNAAAKKYAQAFVELGLCAYSGRWVPRDIRQAKEFWNAAAALGNKEAEVRLAIVAVRDMDTAEDVSGPIATLTRSSGEGSILAEVALGYCYETGRGLPRNVSEAARLYSNGARRGSQDAYRALRRMLDAIRPTESEFRIDDFALQQ